MATKVIFNNKNYNIDESALASTMTALEDHLEFLVNGGEVVWLTGDTATITDGIAKFSSGIGHLVNKRRYLHEGAIIEVVVDGTVIICPLNSTDNATIGTYNGFDITIGYWAINRVTNLYVPQVTVPENTTSVTYKYPSTSA